MRRVIQDRVEDKLSDSVLRGDFKTFERVFVIEPEITEITPAIIDAIRALQGVLSVDQSGDLLIIYCSEDLKSRIEETIKENNGFLVHLNMQSYVSKALIDVKENEIVLKTDEGLVPHPVA